MVTGRVEHGVINVNEEVEIVGIRPFTTKTTVTGVDVPQAARPGPGRRQRWSAAPWHQARGRRARSGRTKPGTTTPHIEFEGQVYILSKDEGGRHTPFFNNYRPQFYFRTSDATGVVTLPAGTEMVMPRHRSQCGPGAVTLRCQLPRQSKRDAARMTRGGE